MAWDKGSNLGSCCYGCEERHEACHDSCPKYIEAKTAWIEYQRNIKSSRQADYNYYRYKVERIRDAMKNDKKGRA